MTGRRAGQTPERSVLNEGQGRRQSSARYTHFRRFLSVPSVRVPYARTHPLSLLPRTPPPHPQRLPSARGRGRGGLGARPTPGAPSREVPLAAARPAPPRPRAPQLRLAAGLRAGRRARSAASSHDGGCRGGRGAGAGRACAAGSLTCALCLPSPFLLPAVPRRVPPGPLRLRLFAPSRKARTTAQISSRRRTEG